VEVKKRNAAVELHTCWSSFYVCICMHIH